MTDPAGHTYTKESNILHQLHVWNKPEAIHSMLQLWW
jgi:hypothetical protein